MTDTYTDVVNYKQRRFLLNDRRGINLKRIYINTVVVYTLQRRYIKIRRIFKIKQIKT